MDDSWSSIGAGCTVSRYTVVGGSGASCLGPIVGCLSGEPTGDVRRHAELRRSRQFETNSTDSHDR